MIILVIWLICISPLKAEQDECEPASCHVGGPIIRFPFRLRGRQPEHCGFPGFDLTCNPNNTNTEFDFQFGVRASARNIVLPLSAKAVVREIEYANQRIRVSILNSSCLPNHVPKANFSFPPFESHREYEESDAPGKYGLTLFNCSGDGYYQSPISCLNHGGFQVYALDSFYYMSSELTLLSNCVKMYNVSYISSAIFNVQTDSWEEAYYSWIDPYCGNCEARGMYCRFKNKGATNETECYSLQKQQDGSTKGIIASSVIGASVIVVAVLIVFCVKKRKRDKKRRIRQLVKDYKEHRPARYTYYDIKKITDGFKHKLGQGGFGTVYKGTLAPDIHVAVKVLTSIKGDGAEFINEVGTIGKIHHVNVVRLVGYCADGYRRALVYEFLENDSLEKYIPSSNQKGTFDWAKMQQIALAIAKGIDYLHQGCNQRILHFDIKPHNILLDHDLNPKVADFGLAKLCSKEQSVVTMTAARGTIGYIAPEVFSRNFGKVSFKSDIYSYGMLLIDMVGGRKSYGGREEDSQVYFPEWMYNQLEKGEDIAIQVEEEEDINIAKRLIIVGLWCIQWYPVDRPSMKVVIQMLGGENMPTMPPNPFAR